MQGKVASTCYIWKAFGLARRGQEVDVNSKQLKDGERTIGLTKHQ